MTSTSNAAAADKAGAKTGAEKVVEKRRALGRGLDSLLPGPRVVAPAPAARVADSSGSAAVGAGVEGERGRAALSPSPSPSSSTSTPAASTSSAEVAPSPVPGFVGELQASEKSADGEMVYTIALDSIDRNPYQTRKVFDEDAIAELADSIRVQGLLQPIVVRPGKESGRFTLILGERRLRASQFAEIKTIPAIVKRVSEQQAAEMTIVENLQRRELNCIEQADAFATLSTRFNLTQQQIGDRVGLSRETVSNYMRLLNLGDGIVSALQTGKLTYSHARVLLMVQNPEHRWTLAKRVMEEKMSVLKLEALVLGEDKPVPPGESRPEGGARWVDPNVRAAQRAIEEILGMRVRIRDRAGHGKISIQYNSLEDFERVVGMLRGGR
jgi:ParB family transcriptional regulator, chromosome partitioning protein